MANPLGSHGVDGSIGDIGPMYMYMAVFSCQAWQIWETFLWRIRRLTLLCLKHYMSCVQFVHNLDRVLAMGKASGQLWAVISVPQSRWSPLLLCPHLLGDLEGVTGGFGSLCHGELKHLKCHIQQVLWQVWGLVPTKHIWVKQSLPVFSYLL